MEWLDNLVACAINKINGTPVERAISEEVAIAKANVKLAELAVDVEKASSKIKDTEIKKTYADAMARIRAKQQS